MSAPDSVKKRLDALIQCARALAFTYGGTREPSADEPEALAQWKAMHAAYDALGVLDTRELEHDALEHQISPLFERPRHRHIWRIVKRSMPAIYVCGMVACPGEFWCRCECYDCRRFKCPTVTSKTLHDAVIRTRKAAQRGFEAPPNHE